jgi:small subunit ribosomal protein S25e
MGGAKKRSISQMEKQQKLQAQKKSGKQKRTTKRKTVEKTISGINIPHIPEKDLSNELRKMKAITPYSLATKYNIKLSLAKDWLALLDRKGTIQKIASSGSLKIYKFTGKN